jgi:hypothetical protein
MTQSRHRPGLTLEPVRHLDRDIASKARVAGAPDFAHATFANGGQDLVGSEFRPDGEPLGAQFTAVLNEAVIAGRHRGHEAGLWEVGHRSVRIVGDP